ncbi:hypothetical protein ASC94_18600 [Massilia sp. Root418]|jgi:hypothetical protein|uniref:glycosyltransferase family 2 protein n=1 Tax=Massilia sp. Root418 TaxID=1736532 RepID=UPI0006F48313|nr:glycosyltransferase family 2 protein [Massilia sp. Root418]KQW89795.1 hypothetical protein ASC94_18600 [Massilia sp. Root418]
MALLEVDFDVRRPTLLFDQVIPDRLLHSERVTLLANNEHGEFIYMVLGQDWVKLKAGDRIVPRVRPEKFVELVMRDPGRTRVGFVEDGQFVCGEPVIFSSELLNRLYDPLKLYTSYVKMEQKFARLAVMTQTFNEGEMLLYWERYYGKLVGYENLYVLNNGSTDGSCERLHPKTNVINMPTGPVDHEHFAQSQSHFQRFLLMRYDWVVKVDTDEFLVCEGDMAETLAALPGATYRPDVAVEVLHDWKAEPQFDFDQGVFAQRQHFIRGTDLLLRPIISRVPTTWTAGNHMAAEFSEPLPGFYVVHLKYFDINFLYSKNDKWSRMDQTENETSVCKQIGTLQSLGQDKMVEYSGQEIAVRLAEPRLPIPAWLPAKL